MQTQKCQVMKSNQMQCQNNAFVLINGIPTCRLDLNWYMNRIIDGTLSLDDVTIEAISLADTTEVNKIISFSTAAATKARDAKVVPISK